MEIGKEKKKIVVEPLQNPVPQKTPAPTPAPVPQREKVKT